MQGNSAVKQHVKEAEKRDKLREEQELSDYRALLEMPQGRRVFQRLLDMCAIEKVAFDPSGSWQSFKLGRQDIGMVLQADLKKASHELFLRMMSEEEERKRKNV